MFLSRTQLNDMCFSSEYCTIFSGKSKTVTMEFSRCKGVFFVQFGTKKLFSLISAFFAAWLAVRFLLPLISPFLLGAILALAAEPAVRALSGRLKLPRTVSCAIGVSLSFLLLAAALLALCAFAVRELGKLSGFLPEVTGTVQTSLSVLRSWLLELSQKTPSSVRPVLQDNIRALFSGSTGFAEQTLRYLAGLAGSLLSHIPHSALTLGTAVLSAYMISAKLPSLRERFLSRIPRERLRKLRAMKNRVRQAVSGWLMAQLKLMAVTFGILLLGFQLLRINHPLLWALSVAAVDAFPILGTGTVLLPWSIICLLQQDTARAIGLLGIYATVSLVRSALEPKLVGQHLGLDPLVTLMALYAGFQLWGIGGMLLAPLLTVTAIQILPEKSTGSG